MLSRRSDRTPSNPKIVDQMHHHVYNGDGLQVEHDIGHDIPAEVARRGVRMAMAWAVGHCPKIRAAVDANRRRN